VTGIPHPGDDRLRVLAVPVAEDVSDSDSAAPVVDDASPVVQASPGGAGAQIGRGLRLVS
jgi:hypothetical protein